MTIRAYLWPLLEEPVARGLRRMILAKLNKSGRRPACAPGEQCDGLAAHRTIAFAAIAYEKRHKLRQRRKDRTVDDRTALASAFNQAGMLKLAQVEGYARSGCTAQCLGNHASRTAACPGNHQ